MLELWVEIQAPSGGMVRLMKMNIRLEELVGFQLISCQRKINSSFWLTYKTNRSLGWRHFRCYFWALQSLLMTQPSPQLPQFISNSPRECRHCIIILPTLIIIIIIAIEPHSCGVCALCSFQSYGLIQHYSRFLCVPYLLLPAATSLARGWYHACQKYISTRAIHKKKERSNIYCG